METAAARAANHGGSLRIPSPTSARKQWRAVSERSPSDEDLKQSKLDQSDERTIYEHGRDPVDVDFCLITVDSSSDGDLLQQRLHTLARQREELQQMEIELRAQMIARSEITEMQSSFDVQIKQYTDAADQLQAQLHEKDIKIQELERRMEEKERELHAVKLDNEAAWGKEDLLREQNKELASFRRERDHSEAERSQRIKQIHDLQEHIQEKDRQLMELQEQNKIAQETIHYKEEQLREAQVWVARVQEMDALHSTTNHSLQTELRERTEQYNQLWLGCQRQFADMERLHLHSVQQLQLELADARERVSYTDGSHVSRTNSSSTSHFIQNSGNQLDANGNIATSANTIVQSNGNLDNNQFISSMGDGTAPTEHVSGVGFAPSSLLGMPAYLPPSQMTPLHSFLMHQQAVPQSAQPQVLQSYVGQVQSVLPVSSMQQWEQEKSVQESSRMATQNQTSPTQDVHSTASSDIKYEYQPPVNGEALGQDYLNIQSSQESQPESNVSPSSGKLQAVESLDGKFYDSNQSEQHLQHVSSQFQAALRLDSHKPEESNNQKVLTSKAEEQLLPAGKNGSGAFDAIISKATVSEDVLLDERLLLACIVRTVPAGSSIRISSTLPNRLGKMLAPLHWHDYRKKYGKLDEFVASHPELFMIEGDYIQLREGAQKMVAASAAAAKVAAAASASSNYSPFLAVTPMAQSHGLKRNDKNTANANHNSHLPGPNGVSFGMGDSLSNSNIKILTKSGHNQARPNPDSIGKQQQKRTR